VREFRTPGFVRGQLGNWLFYLDIDHAIDHEMDMMGTFFYYRPIKYINRF